MKGEGMSSPSLAISFLTPLRVIQEQGPGYRAIFEFDLNDLHLPVQGENMSATMQVGHYAVVSVQWVDNAGNAAHVDGPTVWQSSDVTLVECTVSTGNPLIANLHALGPIGPVQIQATADADLGEGTQSITALLDVTVIAGEASAGSIGFKDTGSGPPVAKRK
jgi:hypothetical protein